MDNFLIGMMNGVGDDRLVGDGRAGAGMVQK